MEIEQVIEFWFGSDLNDPSLAKRQSPVWWQKNPQTDALIRQKFADGLQGLVNGDYDHWLESPTGRLAAIIVADQFSRNMYRYHDYGSTGEYPELGYRWWFWIPWLT